MASDCYECTAYGDDYYLDDNGEWVSACEGCPNNETQGVQKCTITNADKIRASSDEELAAFIADDLCELLCGAPLACDGQCKQKMLDWLREVATDGEQD